MFCIKNCTTTLNWISMLNKNNGFVLFFFTSSSKPMRFGRFTITKTNTYKKSKAHVKLTDLFGGWIKKNCTNKKNCLCGLFTLKCSHKGPCISRFCVLKYNLNFECLLLGRLVHWSANRIYLTRFLRSGFYSIVVIL